MNKYFADVHLELIFYINYRAGLRFSCHWYLDGKVQSPEGLMWHFHVNHLWRHSSQSTLTTAVMKPTPQRAIWHLFFCYKAWELTSTKMCEGSSYSFIALPVAGLPSPGATASTKWYETVWLPACWLQVYGSREESGIWYALVPGVQWGFSAGLCFFVLL